MLRDYQQEAVKNIIDYFDDGKKMGVAILPTAAGKSYVIAALANYYGKALVLQPSKELLDQNYEKYSLYGNKASIYSASKGIREVGDVTFATLGSIKHQPQLFDGRIIIVDECHLYPTEQSVFRNFLEALKMPKVIGLTATPFRLERSMIGSKLFMLASRRYAWDGYAHIMQIADIKKWWSEIEYQRIASNQMMLKINSTGSEYTEQSVVQFAKTLKGKIGDVLKENIGRQALIFVPSVYEAVQLAKEFHGKAVSANTPHNERNEIIRAFKKRELMYVFNVDVLGVGFDHPALEVLVDCNPTLSLSRYYQRVGRLTRPHDNEKTYIDMCGNSDRFGRIEDFEFRQVKKSLHCWSGDKQLTGVLLSELHNVDQKFFEFPAKEKREGVFPVGKFKGVEYSKIPTNYLEWVVENFDPMKNSNTIKCAKKELESRLQW